MDFLKLSDNEKPNTLEYLLPHECRWKLSKLLLKIKPMYVKNLFNIISRNYFFIYHDFQFNDQSFIDWISDCFVLVGSFQRHSCAKRSFSVLGFPFYDSFGKSTEYKLFRSIYFYTKWPWYLALLAYKERAIYQERPHPLGHLLFFTLCIMLYL